MTVTRDFDLPSFSAVEASAGVTVQVGTGLGQQVRAEADNPELLDRLLVEVIGDTLQVSLRHGFGLHWFFGGGRLLVSVAAPHLDRLRSSSGADLHLVGHAAARQDLELEAASGGHLLAESLDVNRLSATGSSGARLSLSGKTGVADLQSSSGASLDASALDCTALDLSSSGGSRIVALAREAARAAASGGSSIRLRGQPEWVDRHVSGGASIRVD